MENKLPAFFLAHGTPFNLIQSNSFTQDLKKLGSTILHPRAIIIISAHWLTNGTFITSNSNLEQIFDFYGFPQSLYEVKYHPPTDPSIAKMVCASISDQKIYPSMEWGLDHAATIVLIHVFPEANIPVLELSIDLRQSADYFYQLGKSLQKLRNQGIMFIGSGNIIHTFREMDWNQDVSTYLWAEEYDKLQKNALITKDDESLIHFERWPLSTRAFQTNDHYYPMLCILGMREPEEKLTFIHEGFQHGSISHRSFQIGNS